MPSRLSNHPDCLHTYEVPLPQTMAAAARQGLYRDHAKGHFLPCALDGRNCAHVHNEDRGACNRDPYGEGERCTCARGECRDPVYDGKPSDFHQCPDLDQTLPGEFERAGLERLQEIDRSQDYQRSVEEIVEHLMPVELIPEVGVKFDRAKLRYDLLPTDALAELVGVYGIGAAKYGDRNWEKGLDWHRVYGALQRHANLWWDGERNDPEDGQHHLASVAWCALALLAYDLRDAGKDTRPTSLARLGRGD